MRICQELWHPAFGHKFSVMKERICLVTGATDGVGKATATELARRGFTVVIAARNAAKAEAVAKEIDGDVIACDLASLAQTRALAQTFKKRHPRLDVLVCNAGVFLPERTLTEDGFETTYQVNYLSHFLLTKLLLGELEKSEQGRIVNLSSSVHTMARFDPENLQSEKKFSVMGTYAASKLFMLMFTEELAKRLAATRITANAVHPGIVRTPMMKKAPGAFRIVTVLALPFSVTPERGASTSVYLATSPDVRGVSGAYFADSKKVKAKNATDTADNRALLWELSERSVG
jgi:NAD(P)-dependent dehydrogenase (short-subunit alcohol dehydrogenase family)